MSVVGQGFSPAVKAVKTQTSRSALRKQDRKSLFSFSPDTKYLTLPGGEKLPSLPRRGGGGFFILFFYPTPPPLSKGRRKRKNTFPFGRPGTRLLRGGSGWLL